jgi:pimeloyl-ACP methyl ester carboxylesterase
MQVQYQFHTGYHDHLHPEASINFQMNRWINYLGAEALEDMQGIAPRLTDLPSYRREFLALAEKALAQGRDLHAAYYFRSAEFFMQENDPARLPARQKFMELILNKFQVPRDVQFKVPYRDNNTTGMLPAYRFPSERPKATLLVHGGFDSYIEEFFPILFHLQERGFTVVCFEGPGQGGALLDSKLLQTHEWHKPVSAVLDYFDLDRVVLIGISWGGCLALRAAALEPRIRQVVAYDVFLDWMDTTLSKLKPIAPLIRLLLKIRAAGPFNALLQTIMQQSPLFDWAMRQAMLLLGASTSFEVFEKSRLYTTRDISSQVRQDVLLMAGAEDHIVPLSHYYEQARLLVNARSLTTRLFTRDEQAQNHCQIGNLGLAVDFITGWIESTCQESDG